MKRETRREYKARRAQRARRRRKERRARERYQAQKPAAQAVVRKLRDMFLPDGMNQAGL